jgi:hypothetical protein
MGTIHSSAPDSVLRNTVEIDEVFHNSGSNELTVKLQKNVGKLPRHAD